MFDFLAALTATALLVAVDVLLRGDLVGSSLPGYLAACVLLFSLIYGLRLVLGLVPAGKVKTTAAVLLALVFSLVYWLQSAMYTVYYQFATAADMGIVLGNFGYWTTGAKSLLHPINLPWLAAYLLIFFATFLLRPPARTAPLSPARTIALMILPAALFVSGFLYVKNNRLYHLITPEFSLAYQVRNLVLEKDRLIKQIDPHDSKGYYARKMDTIPAFVRRGDFNVLFLLLESLRYDHMSLYGYGRDTTPFQRQRFSNAFHFPHAISSTTSTDTSAEAIFTGMDWANPEIHQTSLLWSYIREAGLNQFYVGSHWLQWNGWFGRAFLSEDVDSIQAPLAVDASLTGYDMVSARKFSTTLAQFAQKDPPFFAVVHFAGTHYPYVSPPDYQIWTPADDVFDPDRLPEIINKYDNAIRYNDAAVEAVVGELDRLGLADNTIIIATSDHAEAMYEHKQFFHGKVFWQEGIHVPLYIDIPDALTGLFSDAELRSLAENAGEFVSIIDIFPTLLDIYGIPPGKEMDGNSLLRPYPETLHRVYMIPEEFAVINSRSGEKYHVDNSRKLLRYTRLREDPGEQNQVERQLEDFVSIQDVLDQVSTERFAELHDLNP